mmetsp:Transcript_15980/g.36728  ORF Transcript_15980/g.36728 Transcript_15980/m.36728 type:complete len:139 (+) Transcript_15980:195-611(+)
MTKFFHLEDRALFAVYTHAHTKKKTPGVLSRHHGGGVLSEARTLHACTYTHDKREKDALLFCFSKQNWKSRRQKHGQTQFHDGLFFPPSSPILFGKTEKTNSKNNTQKTRLSTFSLSCRFVVINVIMMMRKKKVCVRL